METSGRERRHRYFTVAAYRQLIEREKLDNSTSGLSDVDLTNAGEFLPIDASLFYDDESELLKYQDSFKDMEKVKGKPRKRPLKNPVLADGSVKQGRPRKYAIGEDPKSLRKHTSKRQRDDVEDIQQMPENEEPRPRKKQRKNNSTGDLFVTSPTIFYSC